MKTLRLIPVICIILAFSANNANSQKVILTQTVHWEFNSSTIPCLTETISGDVFEILSCTNNTLHVKSVGGLLIGEESFDEYDIEYGWNSHPSYFTPSKDWHATLPMRILHNGELLVELHWVFTYHFNGQDVEVVAREIQKVNCK